eukprot:TRINITY_DN10122_c0_g1_i1.p1 TRINITY_DN10122_c0_g1~~TRINITY_DN10122_c0_g1_i1.p1  ORF type:complete len:267 (+),score=48.53 TRINITY_DN10122_c0_g1_i1:108-908(+)
MEQISEPVPELNKPSLEYRAVKKVREAVNKLVAEVTTGEGADRLMLKAIRRGDYYYTERMLLSGVDANTEYEKQPALHIAAGRGFMDICVCLVRLGASVSQRDNKRNNQTALHVAVAANNQDVAAFLISSGEDINCIDSLGRTPLHIAALNGCRTLCTYLLSKGADPTLRDSSGSLPSEYLLSTESKAVEGNISEVPISSKQLHTIYNQVSGSKGYMTAADFRALWDSMDDMGTPKKLPVWIAKLPLEEKIGLHEFCIEALKTSAW